MHVIHVIRPAANRLDARDWGVVVNPRYIHDGSEGYWLEYVIVLKCIFIYLDRL